MKKEIDANQANLPIIWRTRTKNSVSLLVAFVSLRHTAIRLHIHA